MALDFRPCHYIGSSYGHPSPLDMGALPGMNITAVNSSFGTCGCYCSTSLVSLRNRLTSMHFSIYGTIAVTICHLFQQFQPKQPK